MPHGSFITLMDKPWPPVSPCLVGSKTKDMDAGKVCQCQTHFIMRAVYSEVQIYLV